MNSVSRPHIPAGAEVIAYGTVLVVGTIEEGPFDSPITGSSVYRIRTTDGEITTRSVQIVVPRIEFETSWHVWKDGTVIAGGPGISRDRMDEYASVHGGDVVYGWPAA